MNKIDSTERINAFSYGDLGDGIEFTLFVVKKGEIVTDKERAYLIAGADFFNRIAWLEKNENEPMGAKKKLDLLSDSKELTEAWIKSGVNFPKNDKEFLQRLKDYSEFLREAAKTAKVSGQNLLNDLIGIFSIMGEINLRKVYTPLQKCYL